MKRQPKPEPRLREDLSLRDGLLDFLDRIGCNGSSLVQRLLDEHAHELAEKQREWLKFQGYDTDCVCGSCSWCLAQEYIDLIDPMKED